MGIVVTGSPLQRRTWDMNKLNFRRSWNEVKGKLKQNIAALRSNRH
jgi:hypothetical protein